MRVTVSRSGGIAGLRLTWQVRVDDQPDASDWFVLIGELPWDEVPPAPLQPDRYVYRIRCEAKTSTPPLPLPTREATLAEQQLTGPWRELVDRVRAADPDPRRPDARSPRSPRR